MFINETELTRKYLLSEVSIYYHGFTKKIKVIICPTDVNMVELGKYFIYCQEFL